MRRKENWMFLGIKNLLDASRNWQVPETYWVDKVLNALCSGVDRHELCQRLRIEAEELVDAKTVLILILVSPLEGEACMKYGGAAVRRHPVKEYRMNIVNVATGGLLPLPILERVALFPDDLCIWKREGVIEPSIEMLAEVYLDYCNGDSQSFTSKAFRLHHYIQHTFQWNGSRE
eukprot:755797-Hanusia_phi.AAC.8